MKKKKTTTTAVAIATTTTKKGEFVYMKISQGGALLLQSDF